MIYKEYGQTGKKVSAVGCGGMRFLKEDYEKDIGKCAEIVLRAQELGINYFDTAPGYCDDKSELIFGRAFAQMKGEYYVSTKCALWDATTADEARQMLEQSLTRLHRDKITFYNLWCIKRMEEYERFMKKGGVYEGIVKAQEEGLVEHICFTTHLAGEDIAKIAQTGLFAGVTLGYNAVNFAYRQAGVDACAKEERASSIASPNISNFIGRFMVLSLLFLVHPRQFFRFNYGCRAQVYCIPALHHGCPAGSLVTRGTGRGCSGDGKPYVNEGRVLGRDGKKPWQRAQQPLHGLQLLQRMSLRGSNPEASGSV